MNWYAHAVLAERVSRDPHCLLGAMLPDFAAAAGLRVAPPPDGPVARGLRLHVLADAAFHASPEFASLVSAGRGALDLSRAVSQTVALEAAAIDAVLDELERGTPRLRTVVHR